MDDKLSNQATQLFMGDGKTNLSHLEFNTWYHPEICHYLLQLVPNNAKLIRVIFHDTGYSNTTTFKTQLQELVLLSNRLDRPALFIGKELGAENHFIAGIIKNGQLLYINPLGVTQHNDCYQTFAKLIKEKILAGLWFSSNVLQQRDYEKKGLVSCGVIVLELAIHILTTLLPDSFSVFWKQLEKNQPKVHTPSGLLYYEMNIQDLLPSSLKDAQTATTPITYKDLLLTIRKSHCQLLQTLPSDLAKGMSVNEFLQTCKNRPSQVLFNALIFENKTITTIDQISEYNLLIDELNINFTGIAPSILSDLKTDFNLQTNRESKDIEDSIISNKLLMKEQIHKYDVFISEMRGTQEAIDVLISHTDLKLKVVHELQNINKKLEKAKLHAGHMNERIRLAVQTTYDGCINELGYLKTILAHDSSYPVDELNRVCAYVDDIITKVSPKIELYAYSITQMQEVQSQGLFFTQRHLHNALNEKSSLGKDFTALLETIKTTTGSNRYSCFISYAKPIDEANGPDRFIHSFLETLRDHLLLAGFNPLLDFKCIEPGENVEAYMKNVLICNYWLLIGTPSLTRSLDQHAYIKFETSMENIRKVNKLNDIYPMIPLLVIGNATQSLPWHKQNHNTIDLTQSSYLASLKKLLQALSRIPEQRYNDLWKAFEMNYPEHMQALSAPLVKQILQKEQQKEQWRKAQIENKQTDVYQDFSQPIVNSEEEPIYTLRPMSAMQYIYHPIKQSDDIDKSIFWGEIPLQNIQFTGREELLNKLDNRFTNINKRNTNPVIITACYGLGGIGKTQLAIEYVYRHLNDYSKIYWISAGSKEQLDISYAKLANDLNIYIDNQTDTNNKVKQWFESSSHYLLVYDNIPNYELIKNYLPRLNGHILITSRYTQWGRGNDEIRVELFTLEEAREYLIKILGEKSNSKIEVIDNLAKILGYLPLALAQASAYISQKHIPIEDYISDYKIQKEKRKKLYLSNILPISDEHIPIFITWDMTIKFINEKTKSILPEEILKICSCIYHKNIPKELLKFFLNSNGVDDLKQNEILAELINYSLLNEQKNNNLSIHPVLQDVIYLQNIIEKKDKSFILNTYQVIEKYFPYKEITITTYKIKEQLLPHLEELLSKIQEDEVISNKIMPVYLLNKFLSDCYNELGNTQKQKESLENALKMHAKLNRENYSDQIELLIDLSKAFEKLLNTKDQRITLKKALHIYLKENISNDLMLAKILIKLGSISEDINDVLRHRICLKQTLLLQENHYGKPHPDTLETYVMLVENYIRTGNFDEKDKLQKNIYTKLNSDFHAHRHPKLMQDLAKLSLLAARNIREKRKKLEEMITKLKEVYNFEHPDIMIIMLELVKTYLPLESIADRQEALIYSKKICKFYSEHPNYGKQHHYTVTANNIHTYLIRWFPHSYNLHIFDITLASINSSNVSYINFLYTMIILFLFLNLIFFQKNQKNNLSSDLLKINIKIVSNSEFNFYNKLFFDKMNKINMAILNDLDFSKYIHQFPAVVKEICYLFDLCRYYLQEFTLWREEEDLNDLSFTIKKLYSFINKVKLTKSLENLSIKYKLFSANEHDLLKGLRNAVVNNQMIDIKIFLKCNININLPDYNPKSRRTALHYAVIKNSIKSAKILLKAGADPLIKDAFGKTAFDYAKEKPVLIKLLKNEPIAEHHQTNSYKAIQQSLPALAVSNTNIFKDLSLKLGQNALRNKLLEEETVKQKLANRIANNYQLGAAIGRGDSFFDAMAQSLNMLKGSKEYTAKSLRLLCDDYVKSGKHVWVKEAIEGGGNNYEQYLIHIPFTAEELEEEGKANTGLKVIIGGRPEIEGRIICDVINVKLHVIGILKQSMNGIDVTEKLVDAQALEPIITIEKGPYDNADMVHLVNYQNHFVPLLDGKIFQIEELSAKFTKYSRSYNWENIPHTGIEVAKKFLLFNDKRTQNFLFCINKAWNSLSLHKLK